MYSGVSSARSARPPYCRMQNPPGVCILQCPLSLCLSLLLSVSLCVQHPARHQECLRGYETIFGACYYHYCMVNSHRNMPLILRIPYSCFSLRDERTRGCHLHPHVPMSVSRMASTLVYPQEFALNSNAAPDVSTPVLTFNLISTPQTQPFSGRGGLADRSEAKLRSHGLT